LKEIPALFPRVLCSCEYCSS